MAARCEWGIHVSRRRLATLISAPALLVAIVVAVSGAVGDLPAGSGAVAEVGDKLRPDSELLSCDPGNGVVSSTLDYAVGGSETPDLRTPEEIVSDVLTFEGQPELAALELVTVYARRDYRQVTVNGPQGVYAAFTFESVPGVQQGRPILTQFSRCNGPMPNHR
ncbi:hypothetical protein GCM10009661_75170 [Catellatospora chokoriensis]|uniref:Uncharacterized protein n=1 Tax=Catellatospora chokoriensis TaxID=310353 RepID=A0A8J3K141_9ACTN|nr:hypothetical protein Cch02nite_81860 [Catellatospora chokoriensis]